MTFGLIIIGDEILSGKRKDGHFPKVLELLHARGLQLAWAEYLGDDPARITVTLRRTLSASDTVFCCGGIGATPDDHTRQCAAAAAGVPLILHPEAKLKIEDRIRETAQETNIALDLQAPDNLQRLKMGEFPQGAEIIDNPFNKIPGFSISGAHQNDVGRHYFVPGFPVMAWPMIESVLDSRYSHLFDQTKHLELSLLVYEVAESTLTPLMEIIEAQWQEVKVFSLPNVGDAATKRHIELGVKGEPEQATLAFAKMSAVLREMNARFDIVS
ncbi:MAG: molybdopterin-binding protein [Pseudomonadota bacterium]